MNFAQLLIAAFGFGPTDQEYREMNGENPQATREMFAVRSNRSLMDVARRAFARRTGNKNNAARR